VANERLRVVPDRDPDMSVTLVDSNVLLDIFTEDPAWFEWSDTALATARDAGLLVINPLVYAEVSIRFSTIEELDEAFPATDFLREELPYAAGFVAGKALVRYRRQGGNKSSPMPDFYIGAHAAVYGYRLLTRDPARYRTYFPKLTLITPEDGDQEIRVPARRPGRRRWASRHRHAGPSGVGGAADDGRRPAGESPSCPAWSGHRLSASGGNATRPIRRT
jgi:predicted nucleic acid-binding protein